MAKDSRELRPSSLYLRHDKATIMSRIEFTKMQGAGNDYIYVNAMKYPLSHPEERAIRWSRPHTGIGSDGLVLIEASDIADFKMRIFNADGSEAKMCGNASRCIGKYLYEYGITTETTIRLETLSGIKVLHLHLATNGEKVERVTVEMGMPADIHEVMLGANYPYPQGIAVSMGNPHLVIFVEDMEAVDLATAGAILEHHPHFPDRVNVEFAQVLGKGRIRMRVWERGSGITQACGTGACATAVAAAFTGRCGRESDLIMDGGTLHIAWNENDGQVWMTGPAVKVFDGVIED